MGKAIKYTNLIKYFKIINCFCSQGKKGTHYPQSLMYCISRDGNQLLYIMILLLCVLLRIRSGFAVALFVTCNTISILLHNTILKNDYGTTFF